MKLRDEFIEALDAEINWIKFKKLNEVQKLEEENKELRIIIQDTLTYGRIYHHQKKKLIYMGFDIKK